MLLMDEELEFPLGMPAPLVNVFVTVEMPEDVWDATWDEPDDRLAWCAARVVKAWRHLRLDDFFVDNEPPLIEDTVFANFVAEGHPVTATVAWSVVDHPLWGRPKAREMLHACDLSQLKLS